jgi:hypothetical protein
MNDDTDAMQAIAEQLKDKTVEELAALHAVCDERMMRWAIRYALIRYHKGQHAFMAKLRDQDTTQHPEYFEEDGDEL